MSSSAMWLLVPPVAQPCVLYLLALQDCLTFLLQAWQIPAKAPMAGACYDLTWFHLQL
jgi:hypothetical protein